MINFDNIENSLRHEIADDNGDGSCDLTNTALLELITRLRQAEKDAARYRWLRDEAVSVQFSAPLVFNADDCANPKSWIDGEHLDYALDKAMQCK